MHKDRLGILDDAAPEGHVVGLRLGDNAGRSHQHHGQRIEKGGMGRNGQNLGHLWARLLADDFDAVKAANKKLNELSFLN